MSTPKNEARGLDRGLSTRRAARRASANFAEQLMDSPGRSDEDAHRSDNDSASHPFGEPSTRKSKSIKYRYTAMGKHRSSPLKGSSSSSPERAGKARTKLKGKLKLTPKSSASMSQPTPSIPAAVRSLKRKAISPSPDIEWSSCSSLSSLPSSPIAPSKEPPPASASVSLVTEPTPSTSTHRSPMTFPSSPTHPVSKASALQVTRTASKKLGNAGVTGNWEIGMSVWVSVNQCGAIIGDTLQPTDVSAIADECFWWPAQIMAKNPVRVTLFGDFPSTSSTPRRMCTIPSPSLGNILSMNDASGKRRFDRLTFRVASGTASLLSPPPTKKQRFEGGTSLEDRWEAAVSSMEKATALEREGLPAIISSYASGNGSFYDSLDETDLDTSDIRKPTSMSASKLKSPSKAQSAKKLRSHRSAGNLKISYSQTPKSYSPCPPDPTLQIPGELVLAQAPGSTCYWPGKILDHHPDRSEKYRVMFLDDKIHTVSRSKLWTSEERGFVTCMLGQWESAVKVTDDDLDSEDDSEASEGEGQGDAEGVTSGPPPPTEFDGLSVNAQLAYVKPVLRAVLGKGYAPAIAKHNAFMKGGPARAALLKEAGVRGGLDVRFIKAVQRAICKWVLGDSAKRIKEPVDPDVSMENGEGATDPADPVVRKEPVIKGDSENWKIEGVGDSNPPSDSQVAEEAPQASTSEDGSREGASEKTDTCMVVDGDGQKTSNAPPNEASVVAVAPEGEITQCDLQSNAVGTAELKPMTEQVVETARSGPADYRWDATSLNRCLVSRSLM
ncbi:hypothetical protein PISMIDRAFT_17314 [Pisolithus microcarpus 441]|uniref:PWWP domain-containing protein n=1 Tax=Pisolithus microcarpus 441 TaxID=765257 RepID=A0A0C9YC84_9AGAM|nr:hypothetical protein PISMIDRAFT_17314 [Pisolithus microcarpus 441]